MLKLSLVFIIGLHYLIFLSFLIFAIYGLQYLPWWQYLIIGTFVVRLLFSREECPLTTLENKVRIKLEYPIVGDFLTDYILDPVPTLLLLYELMRNYDE